VTFARTNAPVRRPANRSRRRMPASAARAGSWYARPATTPPSTAQASVTAPRPSSAPHPSSTQNASTIATGAPASTTCMRWSRASTSALRLVSTAHWRTAAAGRWSGSHAGSGGAAPAGGSSSATAWSTAESTADSTAGRSALTRPAECGPAASGRRTAGPTGGGAAAGTVKPALVLEK